MSRRGAPCYRAREMGRKSMRPVPLSAIATRQLPSNRKSPQPDEAAMRMETMMRRLFPLLAVLALAACSVTTEQPVSEVEKAPRSGFLTDYSLLQPGTKGQPALRYLN